MSTADNIYFLVIMAMAGTFVIVSSFLVILYRHQSQIWKQQQKLQQEELAHQRNLHQAVLDSEEQERQRIGRNLHDDIGAMLATLRLRMDSILSAPASEEVTRQAKDTAKEMIDKISSSVRTISHQLTPEILTYYDLSEALEELFRQVAVSGLVINFNPRDLAVLNRLSTSAAVALYRILEELIQNTIKHASASEIGVSVHSTEHKFSIIYQDNGTGFIAGNKHEGRGMKNIRTRLQLLNGTDEIISQTGKGVQFYITIPYPNNDC